MYDWQRLDLNGKPRPLNIEHAFNNLYFDRKGKHVEENLISHPQQLESGSNYKRLLLPTHPEHFYSVEQYVFTGSIQINTNEQCMICMLVEGNSIEVTTNNKQSQFNYAETFIIPASINQFAVKSLSEQPVIIVVAFVKD
jgi:mannose-6-phosphate isomerase class I